jgi:hypothetical protein
MQLGRRGFRSVALPVKSEGRDVAILMSPRRADTLERIVGEMKTFDGVKLLDIMEAVYVQGRKDGAAAVFEGIEDVRKAIPHKRPGRPRKRS